MQELVAIIVLNWNGSPITIDCLKSLLQISYNNFKVILVDNGSNDNSLASFEAFGHANLIDIVSLPENLGFTGGNIKGLEFCFSKYQPSYVLLLNNDTIVEKEFLSSMVHRIKSVPKCYAVVPKILYFDEPEKIWFAGGSISGLTGVVKHYGINQLDSGQYDVSRETSFMNGCCALISVEAIQKIGFLDNRFFANSEDVDYSLRITKSGHCIYYDSRAVVYHKVNYSFKANKGKWLAFYLAARGLVLLQKKHIQSPMIYVFYIAFFVRWVLYLTVKLLFLGDYKSILGIYRGTRDGMLNRLRFVVK
jgi:GT2 family glycosyltransferase